MVTGYTDCWFLGHCYVLCFLFCKTYLSKNIFPNTATKYLSKMFFLIYCYQRLNQSYIQCLIHSFSWFFLLLPSFRVCSTHFPSFLLPPMYTLPLSLDSHVFRLYLLSMYFSVIYFNIVSNLPTLFSNEFL